MNLEGMSKLEERINVLKSFASSVDNVVAVVTNFGSSLQREVEIERKRFVAFLDEAKSGDSDFVEGLLCFFGCMDKFGQAFSLLAASLVFHTSDPLTIISRELVGFRNEVVAQFWLHSKQVDDCKEALGAARGKLVRVGADLEHWEKERKEFEKTKNKNLMTSLFKKQTLARLDRKRQKASDGQQIINEEVSCRTQALEMAENVKDTSTEYLTRKVQKYEANLCRIVVSSLGAIAGAVEENVDAMRAAGAISSDGAQCVRELQTAEEDEETRLVETSQDHFTLNPFIDHDRESIGTSRRTPGFFKSTQPRNTALSMSTITDDDAKRNISRSAYRQTERPFISVLSDRNSKSDDELSRYHPSTPSSSSSVFLTREVVQDKQEFKSNAPHDSADTSSFTYGDAFDDSEKPGVIDDAPRDDDAPKTIEIDDRPANPPDDRARHSEALSLETTGSQRSEMLLQAVENVHYDDHD